MELLCFMLFMYLCWKGLEKFGLWTQKVRIQRYERKVEAYQEQVRKDLLEGKKLTPEQVEQNKQMEVERKKQEEELKWRKQLEKEGYDEKLITIILPTLMNDGK